MQPIRIIEAKDVTDFRGGIAREYQPVIIRGAVDGWDLVKTAKSSSADALKALAALAPGQEIEAFFGDASLKGRFNYRDDFSGFNFEKRKLTLQNYVNLLLHHEAEENPPSFFAGAVRLEGGLAPIREELVSPYHDPKEDMLVQMWIGNRTRTAAHYDLPQNLACVIAGRRRFTLFPTDQIGNLYIGPQEMTPAGQAISLVDFHNPDLTRFPKFAEAQEHAQEGELDPGDALYLPSMWFHHVESLEPIGMMINYWWREGPEHLVTPKFALYHALLTLKEMPETERLAWRQIFDHYIFGQNGDPMAHLPEHARGFFGDLTPVQRQQLRQMLARTLS